MRLGGEGPSGNSRTGPAKRRRIRVRRWRWRQHARLPAADGREPLRHRRRRRCSCSVIARSPSSAAVAGFSPEASRRPRKAAARARRGSIPNMKDFLTRVLGSTEETWGELFAKQGKKYMPTTMVAYTGGTQTECGAGQAAMGPFYCPNDSRI